ncbi:RsmB/NOP family class I SAM-dependent RNA methyltransferase [Candidatus Woesearchaeota archaeon]|nr:RsmB/NOP family class I SAM-dependent RNA methyltransferase [Candidatus Woesearchaeota archaeon]
MNPFEERYHKLGHTLAPVSLKQCIRVNTLVTTPDALKQRLEAKGVQLTKIQFAENGFWIDKSHFAIGASIEYLRGMLTPQEAAAQLPVAVLAPKPDERVLDMAAAPGVKTSQIAACMKNKGELVAIEKNNLRVPALKSNLERLGVTNVIAFNTDASKLIEWGLSFDKVLLDAPCMGNYTQRDWLQKHDLFELQRNTKTQQELIRAAILMTKPGGTIVYSTCSLEPEEDEYIIDWALRQFPVRCVSTGLSVGVPGLTNPLGRRLHKDIGHCRRIWPGQTEGFFIAKLVKQ